MRFFLFFSVMLLAIGAIHYAVYRRLARDLGPSPRAKRAVLVVLASGVGVMIAGRVLERFAGLAGMHVLTVASSTLVIGVIVAFAIFMVESAFRAIARALWAARHLVQSSAAPSSVDAPDEPASDGRREALSKIVAATAVTLGGGSSAYASLVGRHDYVVEEVPIRLARLPRELDGYTLVQLSDIHVGLDVGDEELAAALDLVQRARPDRIVLTGDLIDHDPRFAPVLGRFVRKLGERAPVSAIVGNHDYYTGLQPTVAALRKAGADVLINSSMQIEDKLVLGGVDDVWARRQNAGRGPDVVRAFANTDPEHARVLLCHNPSYYPEAADHADLQLSGHTHGGQFSPLVNPARLVLRHGYIRGRYERGRASGDRTEAKSQLYVNRGFGTAGPPARIGSPPEVTKIILTS